jgi:hypothetical protein
MCPLCIGTALLLWSGTGSAGGVAAVALRSIRRRRHSPSFDGPHRSLHQAGEKQTCCGQEAESLFQSFRSSVTEKSCHGAEGLPRH